MALQAVFDLVELCHLHGIKDVVICPGSRNAPLSIGFARSKKFTCYSISDERSAAYFALGMSQKSHLPTIVVCTSGTAAINFLPAVAEAFFMNVPLVAITADRPTEWIDQYDGQTIYQGQLFKEHTVHSVHLNADYFHEDQKWGFQRSTNEALLATKKGPIHINLAIREPFYPQANEPFAPSEDLKFIEKNDLTSIELFETNTIKRTIIVVGQGDYSFETISALKTLSAKLNLPVVADAISNLPANEFIHWHDAFISQAPKPDRVISFGMSLISKPLKQFLRANDQLEHWHVSRFEQIRDPFQSLTKVFTCTAQSFINHCIENYQIDVSDQKELSTSYNNLNALALDKIFSFFALNEEWSEIRALHDLLSKIAENSIICIGNSMAVRYLNLSPNVVSKKLQIFANRGTSGIDGSVSTAVGIAQKTNKPVYCIVGDVSFFYDRNGLWHNHIPRNFNLVVLNNAGGRIFEMIDGPKTQPETPEFLVTRQNSSIKNTIADTSLTYVSIRKLSELQALEITEHLAVEMFFEDSAQNWQRFKKAISL